MKILRNLLLRFGSSILPALVLLSIVVMPRFVRATDTYVLTDLGTLPGGTDAYANAVNNSGQVVGMVQTASTYLPRAISAEPARTTSIWACRTARRPKPWISTIPVRSLATRFGISTTIAATTLHVTSMARITLCLPNRALTRSIRAGSPVVGTREPPRHSRRTPRFSR